MGKKKVIKPVGKRAIHVFLGIFFALISIILFINQTIVPRFLSFPFAYVFGSGSYLVYILIYLFGMKLIFNFKFAALKKPIPILLITFLVLGAFALVSQISVQNSINNIFVAQDGERKLIGFVAEGKFINFFDTYNDVFFSDDFFNIKSLNFFSNTYSVGGGLFGYLLIACGNQLFSLENGGLIVAFTMFGLAFVVILIPIIKVVRISLKNSKFDDNLENFHDVDDEIDEDDEQEENRSSKKNKKGKKYETYNANGKDEVVKLAHTSFFMNDFSDTENGFFKRVNFSDKSPKTKNEVAQSIPSTNKSGNVIIEEKPFSNEIVNEPIKEETNTHDIFDFETPSVLPNFNNPIIKEEIVQNTNAIEKEIVDNSDDKQLLEDTNNTNQEVPVSELIDNLEINSNNVVPQVNENVNIDTPIIEPVVEQSSEQLPKKTRVNWIAPSPELLDVRETAEQAEKNIVVAEQRKLLINDVFNSFHIGASIEDYIVGNSVTRFNIRYQANVSSKSVNNIVPDISIRLNGVPARFVQIVEGQNTSGLEVPNAAITMVTFKEVFTNLPDVKKHPLAVAFGKNISGDVIYADFDEFPHLLVAGTTGSGKSIFVNSIISTLIMRNSPDDLKIVLVDPKTVEMVRYKDMPHLLRPIIYTADDATRMARKLQKEMERRYKLFGESGATNIKEFNSDCENNGHPEDKIPYIIYVLDEYADLIDQCKELSQPVVALAQKARACGIHLLISTQRPSTNVVTGTIKANLPTHVALMTSNSTDSITIIGEGGAEKLLGKGDMLVQSPLVSRIGAIRLQGCYASRDEIMRVVKFLKDNYKTTYDPEFLDLEEEAKAEAEEYANAPDFSSLKEASEEEKYQAVKEWVMAQEYMSISRIQREMSVGFNRAGRFFLRLQNEGIVDDKVDGNKGCKVLVQDKFSSNDVEIGSSEQSYFREDD